MSRDTAEGADHVARVVGRQKLRDGCEGFRPRAAIRFDECAGGRPQPRASYRIAKQLEQHGFELAPAPYLNRRTVVEESAGDLREVLHVRTKHNWLPED